MMKTKAEKGITLVALIITIIVLLILAVVAINAVQNDGIIEYAKNARNTYEEAQENERELLENYIDYIQENKDTLKTINFTIEIGAEVFLCTALEGMTWEQWVNSSYNTYEICISEDDDRIWYNINDDENMDLRNYGDTEYILKDEQIIESTTYKFISSGDLPGLRD